MDLNHHSLFFFCFLPRTKFSLSVKSLSVTQTTNCSIIKVNLSFFPGLRCKHIFVTFHFLTVAFKTSLRQLSFENNSKTLPAPKLLVNPICQGIWKNVMRKQHGSIMKAITHCQERIPKVRLKPWVWCLSWGAFEETENQLKTVCDEIRK